MIDDTLELRTKDEKGVPEEHDQLEAMPEISFHAIASTNWAS